MNNQDLNPNFLKLKEDYEQLKTKYELCNKSLEASKAMLSRLNSSYIELEQNYTRVVNSRGWRMVNSLYRIRDVILPVKSIRWKVTKAILKPLLKPLFWCYRKLNKSSDRVKTLDIDAAFNKIKNCERIDIITVKHTLYVAELLRDTLALAGVNCEIHFTEPAVFEDIPYIIICPQMFKRFPEVYVAFQMEQTVNSRWLTSEYIDILHNAYAVFDYSMVNIEYFSADPVLAPKLYFVPVDVSEQLLRQNTVTDDKEYDLLFYGDINVNRRKEYLNKIGEKFNLKILSNTFGEELYKEMRKAKIIVNVHYYENALLETTRLYEVLSRTDCLIVSEASCDELSDKQLAPYVDFAPIGDIDAMLERIEYWLNNDELRKKKVKSNLEALKNTQNAAAFYFSRFLLANERISFDDFYKNVGGYIQFENDRICLTLPEYVSRKKAFVEDNKYGFTFFPGLKHRFGWVGCGMSYKFMLKKAAEQGFSRVLICEDDVYFPPDFDDKFAKILDFLDKNSDWNVFSGIMADVGKVKILKHENTDGIDFVYLDKMISTVFNIYDRSIFELIGSWDETNRDVQKNTIDRYLEGNNLRIATTCPFLVGHKEDLNSTIWGQQNTMYTDLIANSSKKLENMLKEYKEN